MNAQDGKPLWSRQVAASPVSWGLAVDGGGRIVVVLEDGSVVCYLAEIVLAEIRGVELARVPNEYGISVLQEKK